jgi:hemoglobin-like flavoprotein
VDSLEKLAELDLDPAERVYAKLFAEHPEAEALFIRDVDGAVRGNMLAQALEALLDLAGDRRFGHGLIATERVSHEGLDVPPELFARFFELLRDACRELLGPAWTGQMEQGWAAMLAETATLVRG